MKKLLLFKYVSLLLLALTVNAQERVVSLSPAVTETIFQLKQGNQIVARSKYCDYPKEAKKLPIAGEFAVPNIEYIVSLKPTIVMSNTLVQDSFANLLEKMNIKCEILDCQTINDYRNNVIQIGKLLNAKAEADIEVKRIDNFLKNPLPKNNLKVLWVVWDNPIMIAGSNTILNEVITYAGGINIAKDKGYFTPSFEWLYTNQPDVIIWIQNKDKIAKNSIWQKLDAVKNNHVIFDLQQDQVLRPGPRIFDGIKELNQKLKRFSN